MASTALLAILGIAVVIDCIAVVSDLAELDLIGRVIDGERVPLSEGVANDDRQRMIGTVQLAALVVTAAFFVFWFFRVYRNAESFGVLEMRYGPGWTIGGWLIPIASIWIPKQIVDDTWRASDPSLPKDDRTNWKSLLAMVLVARLSTRQGERAAQLGRVEG